MSEELTTEELQAKIAELTKENEELKNNNNNDTFDELKQKYEEIIEEKNKEITNLQKEVKNSTKKVDDTVDKLNEEVQSRLDANEEYQKLLKTVEELEKEKAETTVDTLIQKGVLLPVQKEKALKLCLNDPESFSDLYRDAKPIVDTGRERKSIPSSTAERIANYFKN